MLVNWLDAAEGPEHNDAATRKTATMNDHPSLNRRQFLRTTGQAATTLAAASALAPSILAAPAPAKPIGVGCIGLGTRGGDLINWRSSRSQRQGGGGLRRLRSASPEGHRAQPEPGGESLRGLPRTAGRSEGRCGGHRHAGPLALPDGARRGEGGQRHLLREGILPDAGRGQADARRAEAEQGRLPARAPGPPGHLRSCRRRNSSPRTSSAPSRWCARAASSRSSRSIPTGAGTATTTSGNGRTRRRS